MRNRNETPVKAWEVEIEQRRSSELQLTHAQMITEEEYHHRLKVQRGIGFTGVFGGNIQKVKH